jgi:uncharacterized damage-inducible protein DinB
MNNLTFFKTCFSNELNATLELIKSCPTDQLDYRPHPVNRSAYEIIEHIISHIPDIKTLLLNDRCDETLNFQFSNTTDAVEKLTVFWNEVEVILENYTIEKWENETVSLFINDKLFASMPRTNMLWFFFFDIVHHRGQLSSYVRPMGGKNPAVYGYSADTSKL